MAEKRTVSAADEALYHKILLIFSVVQLVAGVVMLGLTEMAPVTLGVLAVLGILGIVLAHWCWDKRWGRILGRTLQYLLMIGVVLIAGVGAFLSMEVVASVGVDVAEAFWLQYLKNALKIIHIILLFVTPSMALASRKGRRMDVNTLRISGVVNTLLASVLYFVPALYERLSVGVDNTYYCVFCVACLAVTMVTAFLIPPQWSLQKPSIKRHKKAALPADSEENGDE